MRSGFIIPLELSDCDEGPFVGLEVLKRVVSVDGKASGLSLSLIALEVLNLAVAIPVRTDEPAFLVVDASLAEIEN